MKGFLYCLLLSFIALAACEKSNNNSLDKLKSAIESSSHYDANKEAVLKNIKQSLLVTNNTPTVKQADILAHLYNEYKTYNYDSALLYAKSLQSLSYKLKDQTRIIDARIKIGFILIAAALFNDAFDSLRTIQVQGLPDSIKAEYYSLMGRAYYDRQNITLLCNFLSV